MSIPVLILYYREGCHLCEDMERLLIELLEPGSFCLRKIDIDEDVVLREQFNAHVPVLSLYQPVQTLTSSISLVDSPEEGARRTSIEHQIVDQRVLCEHFLDLEAVREALARYNSEFCTACAPHADS